MTEKQTSPLRILVIGAHPDDCEYKAGGTAALYRQAGHHVCFVSVTDGRSGHQTKYGDELAAIRREEALASGRVLGVECRVLHYPDGFLEPNVEARLDIIRLIRHYQPDLIMTHRPNDYHPDHRYTSQVVCDATYLVTVPGVAPEAPALAKDPVVLYMSDDFTRPYPFSPSVAVDIEPVLDYLVDMLVCHQSQMFDWLPYNRGQSDQVPRDPRQRRAWLRESLLQLLAPLADKYRDLLIAEYGAERGRRIRYIEAFETCEYGTPLTPQGRRRLFPFLPVELWEAERIDRL